MQKEFKTIKGKTHTRYVLETTTAGATGSAVIATADKSLGELQKRETVSVPVTQKPRQGPLKPQTGGGKHRDKKKEMKSGKEKHRKPFAEDDVEESGLQYYTGKKKYGADGMKALAAAGRKGASQEELGRIKDKYIKKESLSEGFDKPDHEISMASNELESIVADARKLLVLIKQYSEMEGLEAWQQSKITKAADYMTSVLRSIGGEQDALEGLRDPKDNPCWKGYHPVGTKKKGGRTVPNCVPNANEDAYMESLWKQIYEKAPPGDKYERMVKHIKKGYAKDGKVTDKEKSIAYATAWKAKNKAKK